MTAGVVRDLLILFAAALAPAGIALFLLRRGLAQAGAPFWRAFTVGILVLGGLAVLVVWGATMFAESEIAACKALDDPATLDCAGHGLWVAVAGIPALGWVLLFSLGSAAFLIARQLRRGG